MTHKEIAEETLRRTEKLMSPDEIAEWAKANIAGVSQKYASAQTPEKTISAQIYTDMIKLGDTSKFIKTEDSMLFGLAELKDKYGDALGNTPASQTRIDTASENDKEKKMHKPLATYLLNHPFFMLHAKTIDASKSTNLKKGMYEWEHPDMVGVRYASEMYKSAFETMQKNAETLFELYSFELKLTLNITDVCEKYFQAVSNSSWSNYGYLVVKDMDENDNALYEKLTILNDQFGIGLIKLDVDLNNIESSIDNMLNNSKIIFKSKRREINYRFLNRFMSRNNSDIADFFRSVNGQAESNLAVNSSFYDETYPV